MIPLSEPGEKYAQIKHITFTRKSSPKLFETNLSMDFDVKDNRRLNFPLEEVYYG